MTLEAIERVARVELAQTPTRLEHLPGLSRELGRDVFIKRDDVMGPAMGGNKTRKLEYLMAEALERKTRRVVTAGGLQSNHAALTAAAACRFGLEAHLFYFDRSPPRRKGNLQLCELFGARMHFVPWGRLPGGPPRLEASNRLIHALAWARVGPHYFIPVGGHSWRGCLGYVRAAAEIDRQVREMGLGGARLIVAAGSGGTLSGLLAGLRLVGSGTRVLGIDVGALWREFPRSIVHMASEICRRLGAAEPFRVEDIPIVEAVYAAPGYGRVSARGLAAIRRLARLEGILLDPVYTGKAFAGLLDLVERGELGSKEPIIFLHTGGAGGLFAFSEELARSCGSGSAA